MIGYRIIMVVAPVESEAGMYVCVYGEGQSSSVM